MNYETCHGDTEMHEKWLRNASNHKNKEACKLHNLTGHVERIPEHMVMVLHRDWEFRTGDTGGGRARTNGLGNDARRLWVQ